MLHATTFAAAQRRYDAQMPPEDDEEAAELQLAIDCAMQCLRVAQRELEDGNLAACADALHNAAGDLEGFRDAAVLPVPDVADSDFAAFEDAQ